jgi:hypothetical protein
MKRIGLVCLGLVLAANTANAQLTMHMSNGWTFSFAGNVNAFLYYENSNNGNTVTPAGIVPGGDALNQTRITTGLLPAFAVFEAKGKEGNTDLGVHFGFAPQVNCAAGVNDCFGAQIDMRQVFLTVGGSWGQLLVGRELGLYQRQNILTDQTLFGVGGTGQGGPGTGAGTTLGRIGYGYVYPNFRAQMTYSTVAGRPYQFSIGVFEAASIDAFENIQTPRVEAEFTYAASGFKGWLGGTIQNTKTAPSGGESLTAWGGAAGLRYERPQFSVTGSGYYGMGIGTTLFGLAGTDGGAVGSDDARKSYGFIGQVTVTPPNSKVTIAGSYGSSFLTESDLEANFKTENTLISGGIYFQATKSLKVVGEFNYAWTKDDIDATEKNSSFAPAFGFMLFF